MKGVSRIATNKELTQKKETLMEEVAQLEKRKLAYENALSFAKLVRANVWNIEDNSTKPNPTYTKYTKEQIITYMKSPATNEKQLRKASVYMYDMSGQYRRMINYYAGILTWAYILSPLNYDNEKTKPEQLKKQYYKALNTLENMNLRHELEKACRISLREGVLYGVIWSSANSFFIQPINPDYCSVTAISDGCYLYSVDMSKIKESKLTLYPQEFTTMYNAYKSTGVKYQEVPEDISFCLKSDDTTSGYSIPPFASTLPMLYDIETYKSLQKTATEISNYKMLGMEIPLNDDGTPVFGWEVALEYYAQLCKALPNYVGAVMSPMAISSYDFEKSGGVKDVDTVSRAEEQFWTNSGTSALLHGSAKNNSAGALKLSNKTDEEMMFSIQNQVERLVNKILKSISGTQKFKLTFLGSTIFNQEDLVKLYKEASTLGIPASKSAYASLLKVSAGDILGMDVIENDILGMDELTPLESGYTTKNKEDDKGRPQKDDTDLDDEGEKTRKSGSNDNR